MDTASCAAIYNPKRNGANAGDGDALTVEDLISKHLEFAKALSEHRKVNPVSHHIGDFINADHFNNEGIQQVKTKG